MVLAPFQVDVADIPRRPRRIREQRQAPLGLFDRFGVMLGTVEITEVSAVARLAALYEKVENYKKAVAMYRDLVENANDPELVVAAQERADELEAIAR